MIKFVVAGLWICIATVGSIYYAFTISGRSSADEALPAYFGGLDYVKTDVISIPVVRNSGVQGYFLARLVYTIEKSKLVKMSVPTQPMMVDQLYSYLYSNPQIDFTQAKSVDLVALKNGIRDAINARVGETLIHEVLVEQVDYLSKAEIRDNQLQRRRAPATKPAKS